MAEMEIGLKVTPRVLFWFSLGFLLCATAGEISTESFTMTTTYPAPTAVYKVLITTGNTCLARDPGGKVGIGTTNPQAALDVNGNVLVQGNPVITSVQCPNTGWTNCYIDKTTNILHLSP